VAGGISRRKQQLIVQFLISIAIGATMIQSAIAVCRLCSSIQWSNDLLKVSAVFLCAGLCFFVFFAAQLFLIDQIERRNLARGHQGQAQLKKGPGSWRLPVDSVTEQRPE
jgi:hypothetical protein